MKQKNAHATGPVKGEKEKRRTRTRRRRRQRAEEK
jgi:hypothetical protein